MRVKHKDLKPDNLIIKSGSVLIADFGISKDLIDEATTATKNLAPQGTPIYWAPEVNSGGRRGRSVDIFSLGCIFLEIATVLAAPPGSLKRFYDFREVNETRAYSRCPMKLVQWIWHLRGHWDDQMQLRDQKKAENNSSIEHSAGVFDLAFLMLDPEPKIRRTSRQLVAMIHAKKLYYRGSIKGLACQECGSGTVTSLENIPLHSEYKESKLLDPPTSPEAGLGDITIARNWEGVKHLWLKSHYGGISSESLYHAKFIPNGKEIELNFQL